MSALELTMMKRIGELKAENARWVMMVERLTAELSNISGWGRGLESDLSHARVEISFLKADLERLRKAGDMLCFHYISLARKRWPNDPLPSSVTDWNDAKEGKPSV